MLEGMEPGAYPVTTCQRQLGEALMGWPVISRAGAALCRAAHAAFRDFAPVREHDGPLDGRTGRRMRKTLAVALEFMTRAIVGPSRWDTVVGSWAESTCVLAKARIARRRRRVKYAGRALAWPAGLPSGRQIRSRSHHDTKEEAKTTRRQQAGRRNGR
jgi:hypothetical protein